MNFKNHYFSRGYNEIEKELEDAYNRGAPQEEIDKLETELSNFVSEEDQIVDEPATSEGISVEEELRNMYARYIDPNQRHGMSLEGIIENMKDVIIKHGGRVDITDEEVIEVAKDEYDYYNKILKRI